MLRLYAEDDLAFFVAKVFHTPHFITNHLQLRLLYERIVDQNAPRFSSWNPSLRALMADILCFDKQRLVKNISERSLPFSLFTRLTLGIVFSVFFREEPPLGHDMFQTESEASFFQIYASHLCRQLDSLKDIMIVLLACPGFVPSNAADILNTLTVCVSPGIRDCLTECPLG